MRKIVTLLTICGLIIVLSNMIKMLFLNFKFNK